MLRQLTYAPNRNDDALSSKHRKTKNITIISCIHRGASTIAKRDDIWQGLLALRLLLALRHFCGSHVNLYMLHKTDLNIAGLKLTCLEYLDHQCDKNVAKQFYWHLVQVHLLVLRVPCSIVQVAVQCTLNWAMLYGMSSKTCNKTIIKYNFGKKKENPKSDTTPIV